MYHYRSADDNIGGLFVVGGKSYAPVRRATIRGRGRGGDARGLRVESGVSPSAAAAFACASRRRGQYRKNNNNMIMMAAAIAAEP